MFKPITILILISLNHILHVHVHTHIQVMKINGMRPSASSAQLRMLYISLQSNPYPSIIMFLTLSLTNVCVTAPLSVPSVLAWF